MNKLLKEKGLFILITALCVISSTHIYAQTSAVKGTVTTKSGTGLMGVTVVEINSNDRQVNGTNTDNDGNYNLRISSPANKLRFSHIGYTTKTESINGRNSINIQLEYDSARNDLGNVVVVTKRADMVSNGFGNTSKRDMVGSVSTIKGDVFKDQPVTSIDQMIQGRAAGVQVVSNSGDPGAGVDIRIRGAGSISGGNDPLYIVDGIPIISTPYDNSSSSQNVARINPIADINPSDIERIDILKDANASAIYGARAANGVVVITTKRGRTGRVDIVYNTKFTFQEAPTSIPVLSGSQYKVMRLEALQNQGNINPSNSAVLPLVDDPTYIAYLYYQNNTNWMKALKQTGFTVWNNLSVSGGGEAMRYNFSTSYTQSKGTFVNTGFKRFTSRFNLDYKVSDKLKFSANISFARTKKNDHANYMNITVYQMGHLRNPSLPIYDIDVNGNQLPTYFSLGGNQFPMDNPVAFAKTVRNDAYSTNLKPNIRAELQIIKGLKYTSNASLDFVGENGLTFFPPEATGNIWNDVMFNSVSTRDFERTQMILDNMLNYSRTFDKLKTSFLLGNTFNLLNSSELRVTNFATASTLLNTLGAAGGYSQLNARRTKETIVSAFVKADLIYNDRYGFNATVRRDGSSKFGGNRKYGNFPSLGVYWRASAEPFMSHLKFLTDLKFRATWGQLGNSGIPNYAYISQFVPGANYNGSSGVSQQNPQLNDLRWETIESSNLAVDLELFDGRFGATVEVYNKLTKDLLFWRFVPTSSGLSGSGVREQILTNLGNIRNRGIEAEFSYEVVKEKKPGKFGFDISFNIGHNQNKVTSLPGGTLKNANAYANFGSQIKQGDPLGTYYGLVFKGVYANDNDAVVRDAKGNIIYDLNGVTPRKMRLNSETGDTLRGGDAIYEDFNHDGIINDQDRILIGNANPDFFGGFNSEFRYKGFALSFFIQFYYGNDIINGMRYSLERMENNDNQAITTLKRWRKQGDITDMPRALNGSNRNSQGSTRWVEDGSYARVKFITLSYRFPKKMIQRLKLKGVDAFITANDLFTFTKYTGADPEISLSPFGNDAALIGLDRGLNPRSAGFTLGINFKF